MKELRLINKRLAYCEPLLQALFNTARVRSDPEGYRATKSIDVSAFANYVNKVRFILPEHSVYMTWPIYNEIVHSQEDQGQNSKSSFDKDALRLGFQKYQAAAIDTYDILTSEQLRSQWTAQLKAFSNCHDFSFPLPPEIRDPVASSDANIAYTTIKLLAYHHIVFSEQCRRLFAPVGDLVFAAAVYSLAGADSQVLRLNIEFPLHGFTFDWERLPGWSRLDLSQMHTLHFDPEMGEHAYKELIDNLVNNGLAAVFKKCGETLLSFTHRKGSMRWPGEETVALPSIERIVLGDGRIRPQNFFRWMMQMRSLKYFELFATKCKFDGYREIFDAVKYHMKEHKPKEMIVDFTELPAAAWSEIGIHADLANLDDEILNFDETAGEEGDDIEEVLIRYMVDLTPWHNRHTRHWFDSAWYEDEDEEDENNEQEGGSEEEDGAEHSDNVSD